MSGGLEGGVSAEDSLERPIISRPTIPWSGETLLARNKGASLGLHSIKLYTFAYKFISKPPALNKSASTPVLGIRVY
jgi:hypothetical protein